jgi:hypothetical protein
MQPAFSSQRQAAAFAFLLLVLLALPAVVAMTGWTDERDVYPAINIKYGPFPWIQQQTYGRSSDVDLAFLGSSRIWNAVNTPYVQQQFSEALGRDAQVISLCWPWPGFDAVYTMARNLINHRRVHTLVVYDEGNRDDLPHRHAHRWFLLGRDRDMLSGLPWSAQVRLYGDAVLGMPRQLIRLVRPNRMEEPTRCRPNFWNSYYRAPNLAENLGSLRAHLGYGVSPRFVALEPGSNATTNDVLVYGRDTRNRFQFTGPPTSPYQLHFARKLAQLCQEHGTRLVFLHPPCYSERAQTVIAERECWPDVLGAPADIVGIPPARLFAGIPPEQGQELYYEDMHFNVNGQDLFTRLITPTLLKLYDASIHHN